MKRSVVKLWHGYNGGTILSVIDRLPTKGVQCGYFKTLFWSADGMAQTRPSPTLAINPGSMTFFS